MVAGHLDFLSRGYLCPTTRFLLARPTSNGHTVPISAPSALSGRSNSGSTCDAGTASATINGNVANASWSQGSTTSSIATALASAINVTDDSFLHAQASGNVINLASIGTGASTNWSIGAGTSYDSTNFTTSSFTLSGSGMSNGTNAQYGGATVYSYTIPSTGGYDRVGNVTSVADSVVGNWTYSYDTLNRLLSWSASSGSYSGHYGCWAYDSFGTRTAENIQTSSCPTIGREWISSATTSACQRRRTGKRVTSP